MVHHDIDNLVDTFHLFICKGKLFHGKHFDVVLCCLCFLMYKKDFFFILLKAQSHIKEYREEKL